MKTAIAPSILFFVSLATACDGCDDTGGAPRFRVDGEEDSLPVGGNEGEGEGEGEGENNGGEGGCAEIGGCSEGEGEGEGESGTAGEGEGEGENGTVGEGEGETPPPACREESFANSERIPPRVLLLVDKSSSMANAVGQDYPESKWAATRSTIIDVVSSLDDTASFGLMMFPGFDVDANLCASGDEYVAMRENAALAISLSLLAVTEPRGATPTAASLRDAKAVLDALPAEGGARAVVLATDGGPNCNVNLDGASCRCTPNTHCGPNNPDSALYLAPANCIDDDDAVAAARALNDAGYAVFVVGIPGINGFEDVMNSLADAGGTARAGAIRYYDAGTSTDLADALESATFRVSTCRFDLAAAVAAPEDVTVRVDGAVIAQDPTRTSGWDLVDDDTVELFGSACVDGASSATGVVISVCG